MNKFINAYRRNNDLGLPFHQLVAKVLHKAESLAQELVESIKLKNFENRYFISEKLIKILSELHQTFQTDTPTDIHTYMVKYCLRNMRLLTKINLKNDEQLAISLMRSFNDIANTWEDLPKKRSENK